MAPCVQKDRVMRYWLLIFLSFVCGAIPSHWRFSDAALFQHSGPLKYLDPRVSVPSAVEQEIRRVEREVDQIEQEALAEWHALPITPSTRMDQVRILGKLLLFDKNLSVYRNEACSFCHMPDTDFTGPISELNQTAVAYPGSVRTRFGRRKPQSYTYSPFYPVLRYNSTQQDFYGGN